MMIWYKSLISHIAGSYLRESTALFELAIRSHNKNKKEVQNLTHVKGYKPFFEYNRTQQHK